MTLVILQHPCALMDGNNELRAVLLAARLVDYPEVSISDWTRKFDIMPLVVHDLIRRSTRLLRLISSYLCSQPIYR